MAKKKSIDFEELSKISHPEQRKTAAEAAIASVKVPCLTDALVSRKSGGQSVIMVLYDSKSAGVYDASTKRLQNPANLRWKIRAIINRDGTKPKPGDEVSYMYQEMTHVGGKRLSTTMRADMDREGDSPRRYQTFILDSNLCFECGYDAAMYFLTQFGVHYENESKMIGVHNKLQDKQGYNGRFVEVVDLEENVVPNHTKQEVKNVVAK